MSGQTTANSLTERSHKESDQDQPLHQVPNDDGGNDS